MMPADHRLPVGAGIGLKPEHFSHLLTAENHRATSPENRVPAFVEVHPQNYFGDGGPPHRWLTAIAEKFALSFHSTTLSLGSAGGLNQAVLNRLAELVDRYAPVSISDHLSWSDVGGHHLPDLLPVPYTAAALDHFVGQVGQVQDRLARTILIENPSRYLRFLGDEMSEVEFLTSLCQRSGCGLLLDVNNVIVCANNLGFEAGDYLSAINPALVGEIHLAGHAIENDDGSLLFVDDHASAVSDDCWAHYASFITRSGPIPTLIEWDNDVPAFEILVAQAAQAWAIMNSGVVDHARAA